MRALIETELTLLALEIAQSAHEGQVDIAGVPYICHPLHLAEKMDTEMETVVALLHDAIEDCEFITEEYLREKGIPKKALTAISILSRTKGTPYMEYIGKVQLNPLARKVKIEDLKHNSDLSRLPVITENDIRRTEKYKRALLLLLMGSVSQE